MGHVSYVYIAGDYNQSKKWFHHVCQQDHLTLKHTHTHNLFSPRSTKGYSNTVYQEPSYEMTPRGLRDHLQT